MLSQIVSSYFLKRHNGSVVEAEQTYGYVYVIAEKTSSGGYTGYYKVGKTQWNLDARIAELQTGNPGIREATTGSTW